MGVEPEPSSSEFQTLYVLRQSVSFVVKMGRSVIILERKDVCLSRQYYDCVLMEVSR